MKKSPACERDIELRMEDATIQSWYPPVVRMPFGKWMEVDGGRFKGVGLRQKAFHLYLTINGQDGCRDIEVIDLSNGSLIQTVHVMRGGADGGHH